MVEQAGKQQHHKGENGRLGFMVQVGLLAGPFLTMVDSSIVNVALPDISDTLHSSTATVQWVASAYLLVLAMALTGTAYLAKRFGTKPVYIASLVGFTVTSGLCAITPSIGLLIGARIVQGLFAGPLVPLAMNMLFGKGDTQKQISAAAGMILFLAPAVGPSLGGVLIHWAGWHLIFLVNVPVGIFAVFGASRIPLTIAPGKVGHAHFDVPGLIMLALGLAGLTYGTTNGPQVGWFSSSAWPYWAIGVVLLITYVAWALRRKHPIVDIGLARRPQEGLGLALTALVAIVTFAVILLAPIFMQEIQGKSALVAGLALLPQGLITGIGTVLGNKLPARWGVRWTAMIGMLILTLSTVGLVAVKATSSIWLVAIILVGRGFAIGLVIQPLLNRLLQSLPANKVPDGSTFFNVVQRIGGTLGIALVITFFQEREHLHVATLLRHLGLPLNTSASGAHASLSGLPASVQNGLATAETVGFHDAIWLVVGVSALGFLMTFFLRSDTIRSE